MIYLGDTKISKLYLGSTKIGKAYLGGTLVYQQGMAGFSVTYNLTNVTSSNMATSVLGPYTTTLSPAADNYSLGTVTVTMGGIDITSTSYSNGVITISNVTDEIIITASGIMLYTPVDWVDGNKVAYIDTGYVPDINTSFAFKFTDVDWTNTPGNYSGLFGQEYISDAVRTFRYTKYGASSTAAYPFTPAANRSSITKSTTVEGTMESGKTVINGTTKTISYSGSAAANTNNMLIFTQAAYASFQAKCWYFKIYQNGTLVRDYRPAYLNNTYGMYELKTNTFKTSVTEYPLIGPAIE